MKIEEEVNEVVFGVYAQGFTDGQIAMVHSMKDLGLITDAMGDLIMLAVKGYGQFDEHFRSKPGEAEARIATRKIMGM